MWGLWWTKRHWGRFPPSTSVSPANHSTNFCIIIITRGWHNRPISGRSGPNWTPPPTKPLKKLLWGSYIANHFFTVPWEIAAALISYLVILKTRCLQLWVAVPTYHRYSSQQFYFHILCNTFSFLLLSYLMTLWIWRLYSVDDGNINEYGRVAMRIGRGNRRTRRKPAPVPLRLPQIPYDVTQDGTQVGS
jgi:hypothetical protein